MQRFLLTIGYAVTILTMAFGTYAVAGILGGTESVYATEPQGVAAAESQKTTQKEADPSTLGWIMSWVLSWISGIVAQFLKLAGALFDAAIYHTVLRMGDNLRVGGELMPGILFTWSVLRDVSNIIFIFALMFIGIATILGLQSYGWRSLMVRLVIAALLINFSLLFARVAIDVTNIAAAGAYGTILQSLPADAAATSENQVITSVIMGSTWMQTLANPDRIAALMSGKGAIDISGLVGAIYALGTILMLVMIFVLTAGAFMLISRFVILTFLMIVSPIAFASMILPQTRHISGRWWSSFVRHALFAPAFMLTLFVALTLMTGLNTILTPQAAGTSLADTIGGLSGEDTFTASVLLINFAFIAIAFVTALIVAAQMGAYGSHAALSIGKRWSQNTTNFVVRNTAGKVVKDLGEGARRTVGAAGLSIAQNDKLADTASGKTGANFASRWAARKAMETGEATSKMSFDARHMMNANMFGKAQKGGRQQDLKDVVKREKDFADLLDRSVTPSKDQHVRIQQQVAAQQQSEQRIERLEREAVEAERSGDVQQANLKRAAVKAEQDAITATKARIQVIKGETKARKKDLRSERANTLERESRMLWNDTNKGMTGEAAALATAAEEIRQGKSDLKELQELLKKASKEAQAQPADTQNTTGGGTATT